MKKFYPNRLFTFVVAICFATSGCGSQNTHPNQRTAVTPAQAEPTQEQMDETIALFQPHATFHKYNNLEELEEKATVIVNARFTGNRTIHNWYDEGEVAETATKSEIEIKRSFKGSFGKGERVYIYEPGYFDQDTYINIEGYNLMNEKGNYLLFLRPIPSDDTYVIVGMFQGKYDLNIQRTAKEHQKSISKKELATVDYFGEYVEHFNQLKDTVKKKYGTTE